MSRHASNMRGRDIITASIPWSPDEFDFHIKVGDWIANPTPDTGNPLDWVYQVLALTHGKAEVLKFQRFALDGRIQATSQHIHTIHTAKYRTMRVLHQEKPGATLRVSKIYQPRAQKPSSSGSSKQVSSGTSHGTWANGIGAPTRHWAMLLSLVTPPEEVTSTPDRQPAPPTW